MAASTAQERREAQREAIRAQRQAELKRQRSRRTAIIAAIVVAALAIAAGIGYLVWSSSKAASDPAATPAGVASEQPYLVLGAPEGSGKPVVELHLDFMCPICGIFEQYNGEDLANLIENEDVTVHLYMRRFLDSQSTTGDYSSRAANAAAAVYNDDPAHFIAFQQLLFTNQPAEGSAGLDDETLWTYAQQAGASEQVQKDIQARTFQPWIRTVVDPGAQESSGGAGTPYVTVNGTVVTSAEWSQPGVLLQTIQAAGGTSGASASDGGGASDGGNG